MGKREKSRKKTPPRPTVGAPDVVLSAIALVLLAGLRMVAGPCVHADGSVAACAMAGRVLMGLGIVSVLLSVMRLLAADLTTKRSFDFLLLIVGVAVAVAPGTALTLCAEADMPCRAVMLPFARVVGVALGLAAVACEATVDHEVPTGRKRRR